MKHRMVVLLALVVAAAPFSARASLSLVSGPALDRTHNLVSNGSFEIGAPAIDGDRLYWATGTSLTPFAVPTGWSSSGASETYAWWGNDGVGPATFGASDYLPDGRNGMYFGNLYTDMNDQPTFHADGTVTFTAGPTFTPAYGQPSVLRQTVATNTSSASSFRLSFWTSGEEALLQELEDGIFGFRMTNVLPGDPIQYLTTPGGLGLLGTSHLYQYQFTPINSALPVTLEFINWGHWAGDYSTGLATELVLDDVIINDVPGPGCTSVMLGLPFALSRRRR